MNPELASPSRSEFCRILGIPFFLGDAEQAVARMRAGGLLAVPAAPALNQLTRNSGYREALLNADLVIPDSGFMVLVWNLVSRPSIPRLSGFKYLQVLLGQPDVREPRNAFWIMASASSATRNRQWLASQGIEVPAENIYIAPFYGEVMEDQELLAQISRTRPLHIIVTLGGGTQERLGLYLKRSLDYSPAIHCIGAAIAFLSGDQVRMPQWADKLYVGWAFRCLSKPRQYVPRYWSARTLARLMVRYGSELPPLGG